MKRKNRLTLNFLSPNINPKRRQTFRVRKETIPIQYPIQRAQVDDISEADVNFEDFVSHDIEESGDLVTAHTKRKLKLAEHWMEIRDSVYSTVIGTYAFRDADCFLCQAPAVTRCIQCGPYFMCLQCCLQAHSLHNIHHYPEMWQVCT